MYGIIQILMIDISHLKFCGYVGNKKRTNLLEHYQSEDQGKDWNKSLCHSWKEVVKNTEGWNWLMLMYKGRISLYHQWWIFDFYYWRDGRQSPISSVWQFEIKKNTQSWEAFCILVVKVITRVASEFGDMGYYLGCGTALYHLFITSYHTFRGTDWAFSSVVHIMLKHVSMCLHKIAKHPNS